MPIPKLDDRRALREALRQLRTLTDAVSAHLAALNQTMQGPATEARGQAIARLANALDLANDVALRYGLGLSLPAIARRKQAARRERRGVSP